MSEPILFIVDGHSLIFKAYHAIQNLSNSRGVPTNAVYGFVQILHRLLKVHQPNYLVVALDSIGPTFRHEIYKEYKANRPEAPEDLSQQIEIILQILSAMRVRTLALRGFEADDIIATVATRAAQEGFRVKVVTADKDLFQLVGGPVTILRPENDKDTEYDEAGVVQKMGVPPSKIADYLAMVGDSSDNIPGIPKVGPKTAIILLEQFGDMETVLASADQLKGKQKDNIIAGRESARLSRKLVELVYDVPVEFEASDFERQPPDVEPLSNLYRELEFKRLLDELGLPTAPARETRYEAVFDVQRLADFAEAARREGAFAFDTETDSLSPVTARLIGISLSCEPGTGLYVPIGHDAVAAEGNTQLSLDEVFPVLDSLFRDQAVRKVAHNIKFDKKILLRHGFIFEGQSFDTMLASWVLNADRRAHGLKDLSADTLCIPMQPITQLIGTGKNQQTFDTVPISAAVPYAAADSDCTYQLYQSFLPRLHDLGMRSLFDTIEMPLVDVLMDMELSGVAIDPGIFHGLSREMEAEIGRIVTRIYEIVGRSFNLASPKQVAEVLFTDLQLPTVKKKKTGQSTDVDVLEQLAPMHEVPGLILEFRQIEKLKSTYVDVLPTLVEPSTGRIHTSYNQAVAATGRLSSSDPNLQNIPVRTQLGRRIREGFIPLQKGHVLLAADYSQIELRVLAHMAADPALIDAFKHDRDVHALTASEVFGVAVEDVTPEMRDQAKVINFGIIYGMSPHGLSTRLKISAEDARRFIEGYFNAYAGVKQWIDHTLAEARRNGYVSTLAGRRRYLTDINSKNFNARSAAERFAVNAPIQGTSADMIKIAMINLHNWLKASDLRARMIMQVHDELIFDLPEGEVPEVEPRVVQLMQDALPLSVPVRVESYTGRNWAEC